jgi:hypothetical protein
MHKGLNFPYENRTKLVCWWREWHKSNRGENDRQGRNSVSPFAGTLLNPEWAEFRRRKQAAKQPRTERCQPTKMDWIYVDGSVGSMWYISSRHRFSIKRIYKYQEILITSK